MFGSFLHGQIAKKNKKITIKKQSYEQFHIPVEKIKAEKIMVKKINQQCEKLKSEFKFITQEINRQNSKKRTHCGYNIRNTLNTGHNFRKSQKKSEQSVKKQDKDMLLDLTSLLKRMNRNKRIICSQSLRKYQQTLRNPLRQFNNTNRF